MRALLTIAIVGSIGACDVVFGIDQVKNPSGSGGEIDGGIPVDGNDPLERYYVQSKAEALANGAHPTSMTVTLGNVTGGDVILVAVCTVKSNVITSVSDTGSNTYKSLGPAMSNELQSDVYIGTLATTSSNFSVIVKFAGSGATNPDIRVAEYRHLAAMGVLADTTAMEGVSQLSASVHGVSAPSMLFAANCMKTFTLDIPGFTKREQPLVNGDRIADRNVEMPGDFVATTLGSGSGAIIMTLAAVPAQP